MDGMELYDTLRARGSKLPVIFLTGYADVPTARRVLLAGAADFLQKPVEKRVLLQSIREAFARDSEAREASQLSACLSRLTRREWDVLRLVVAGKPNKVIGVELGISTKTVEAHRARVMAKTRAASVADLVRMFSAFEAECRAMGDGQEADSGWRRAE
jgi:two-component system response regulator FixJ